MKSLLNHRADGGKTVKDSGPSLHDRIQALAHRIEYRRMVDFEDREAIYHLRRQFYYERNNSMAEELATEAIDDPHEENSATIGLFIDNRLVGSVKVTVATEAFPNCQSRKYAPEQVDALLKNGGVFIDPGRLVADITATAEFPELPFLLIRVPILACQYFEAHSCLSLVSQKHVPFYRRIFSSNVIGGPIWGEPLQCDVMLMCGSVDDVRASVLERFPFWKATYLETRQMFGPIENWSSVNQHKKIAA